MHSSIANDILKKWSNTYCHIIVAFFNVESFKGERYGISRYSVDVITAVQIVVVIVREVIGTDDSGRTVVTGFATGFIG